MSLWMHQGRPEPDWEVPALSEPVAVEQRLESILRDLGERQIPYERATEAYIHAKRRREKAKASAFLSAKGSVAARNAIADLEAAEIGSEEEAAYMAQKAALSVLEAMEGACQSLLRSQGRNP